MADCRTSISFCFVCYGESIHCLDLGWIHDHTFKLRLTRRITRDHFEKSDVDVSYFLQAVFTRVWGRGGEVVRASDV